MKSLKSVLNDLFHGRLTESHILKQKRESRPGNLIFFHHQLKDFLKFIFVPHFSSVFSQTFFPSRHINEDKRKTEGQRQIFDVVYEVDGCPVSNSVVLRYIFKNAMVNLSKMESKRGA